jgi:hypothetical protein
VFQVHPVAATGDHSRIKQHCGVHGVRLCLSTDGGDDQALA